MYNKKIITIKKYDLYSNRHIKLNDIVKDNENLIIVLLNNISYRSDNILLFSFGNSQIQLQNIISKIPLNHNLYIISDEIPLFLTDNIITLYCGSLKRISENYLDFYSLDIKKCYFAFNNNFILDILSLSLVTRKLLSEKIPDIEIITKPKPKVGQRILFIFPERMLPLKRAFYQRGFDTLRSIANSNSQLDIVIFGPNNNDLKRIEAWLSLFATNVYTFPLIRKNLIPNFFPIKALSYSFKLIFRRYRLNNIKKRIKVFNSEQNKNNLKSVIVNSKYSNIITTCIWTFPIVKYISSSLEYKPNIIIDMHDIFYIIDNPEVSNNVLNYFYYKQLKKIEVNYLQKADLLIAISPSDLNTIKKIGVSTKSVLCIGKFDHIEHSFNMRNGSLTFGYIGTNNLPNKMAINLIKNLWLPIIKSIDNSSELLIAGQICETNEAKVLNQQYPEIVKLLGFQSSLSAFYNKCDIMLSPIEVRGGLNFKSVESLMSGCELITTKLGAQCLIKQVGVWIIPKNITTDEIKSIFLEVIATSKTLNRREVICNQSSKIYNHNGYEQLIEYINSTS